ncbi:MAG: hypothetical protein AB1600_12055 [Bacteroidota bacterium]
MLEFHGISLDDLALDVVADIFERNKEGKFTRFDKFFQHIQYSFESEEHVFVAFKRFVILVARTQLSKTISQADSTWAKIFRNLKLQITKHRDLSLEEDFRGFVVVPRQMPANNELQEFPIEELEQKLLSQVRTSHDIPEILYVLNDILCHQETYRRSFPLIDLVEIVRKLYMLPLNEPPEQIEIELSPEEIERIQHSIFSELDAKIFSDYMLKGKLNSEQATILSNTLREIMAEWWSGNGNNISIANITIRNFGISQDEYKNRYQNKIEYLVRLAKERVAHYLEKKI